MARIETTAAHDVDEVAVDVIRPEELGEGERNADDQNGREHFEGFLPAHHRAHQPEGHDHRGEGKDAADGCAQIRFRQTADRRQRMDGNSDAAPGHRRGVGNQIKRRGMERPEAEPDHESARNCDRRAESGRAFDKRAETERHQQHLQAAVGE